MSSVSFFVHASQPATSATASGFTAPQARTTAPQPQFSLTLSSATISQAARDVLAATNASSSPSPAAANTDSAIEARLAEIRARGPINRSPEDHAFLFANDKRLAEITAQGKPPEKLTADELDYLQKATGMVNTFANLSPAEKALYDKAVARSHSSA